MKNFIKGIGSILNIMPALPPRKQIKLIKPMTPEQIDAEDWKMVGESFRMATDSLDAIIGKPPKRKARRSRR